MGLLGKFYLQISLKLVLTFQVAGFNIIPIETTYTYLNPTLKKVYVIEWKYIDSLGLQGVFDTTNILGNNINFTEDTNSVRPVKLTQLEVKN